MQPRTSSSRGKLLVVRSLKKRHITRSMRCNTCAGRSASSSSSAVSAVWLLAMLSTTSKRRSSMRVAATSHHVVRSTRSTLNALPVEILAPDRVDLSSHIIVVPGTCAECSASLPAASERLEGLHAFPALAQQCSTIPVAVPRSSALGCIAYCPRRLTAHPCSASPPPARLGQLMLTTSARTMSLPQQPVLSIH